MRFKKVISIGVMVCLLTLTACGETGPAESTRESPESTQESPESTQESNVSSESSVESEPPASNPYTMPESMKSNEDIENARNYIWYEYLSQVKGDAERAAEVENRVMPFGEVSMKYGMFVKGEPGESGYPLFIALHGGGGSDTPDLNNGQWAAMGQYYWNSVKNGLYVFPRGVRDTWDCHFNPESYPLYDRLIENLIAFRDVDPNRVYLTGFSAGGDGVYGIVSKMTDRFAAANMSAGHPNGLPLWNLYNMPFQIQVGEKDDAYERNTVNAQYGLMLDEYRETLGGGYVHNTYIHQGKGHNFGDNVASNRMVIADIAAWLETGESPAVEVDANAIRFLEQQVRDPLPERVVWDLSQRADQRSTGSFYWLQVDKGITEGKIIASYDRETNTIQVEECTVNGEVTFLLGNDMLDLFEPVNVDFLGAAHALTVEPSMELLYETTAERGDPNYQFAAKISFDATVRP